MPIVVAHPDTQHSLHAARGLKRADMLECLFTSFSLNRPAWLNRTVRVLAPSAYRQLVQHRAHPGLSTEELRVFPIHLAAGRLGPSWDRLSRRAFARAAARISLRRGAGVMAFNSNATVTFRALEGSGLPCVLDQSIAHRRWRERVGAEELGTFGGWARTSDSWATAPEVVAEEDEEVARADLILCGSDFCASTMVAQGVPREKLAVVEYGADTERFSPGPVPRDEPPIIRLLFVGALVLRKGIPYLLEAVKRVQGLHPRLTLAGLVNVRQEALQPYRQWTSTRGAVLHADMPALYREHDIYVFPSLVEGSSLSIYEALASGLPVITTPNAGSIVRDGIEGFIVPARDTEALSAAIERLAKDRELRLEMGRAARRRALAYGDWAHYGQRLVASLVPRFPQLARTRLP